MNFSELLNEVYTLTNRPDLEAKTTLAIRKATLLLHNTDFYPKDIREQGVQFASSLYQQALEYRVLFPRWRALKYFRKTDSQGSGDGQFFDLIVPEQVLDEYSLNRDNVCYLAGSVYQLRSSTQFQYIIVGCYQYPDVNVATFDSWIALDHPYAIIQRAAASIFKAVGDTDEFAAADQDANEELAALKISAIQAQGY